jgi:hypothetical protein
MNGRIQKPEVRSQNEDGPTHFILASGFWILASCLSPHRSPFIVPTFFPAAGTKPARAVTI